MKRAIAAIAMAAWATAASGEVTDNRPPAFKRDVACMVRVLARQPHVDRIRSGLSDAQVSIDRPGVLHPFVEYRTIGRDGRRGTIRFDADFTGTPPPTFITVLNGLSTSGSPGPDDWSTGRISKLWRKACRVNATAIFE